MIKKALYVATSDIHLHTFHRPYIDILTELGFQVDLVFENRGNNDFERIHQKYFIDFPRSINFSKMLNAYLNLRKIINENRYDIIHCHTPFPSVLARIAAMKARKRGSKVIYTAHGFHFFKGAPIHNWFLYFTVEFILSKITDFIIVLNKEDYFYSTKYFKSPKTELILGIGCDKNKFFPLPSQIKKINREKLGLTENNFVLVYTAEFIYRKNHQFLLESMVEIVKIIPFVHLILVGKGKLMEEMILKSIQLGIRDNVSFLGFRNDVNDILSSADVGISVSRQEGMGMGVIECMASGLPVVCTLDRGHSESIHQNWNGMMFPQQNRQLFVEQILYLYSDVITRKEMANRAILVSDKFELNYRKRDMREFYAKLC